ncbi:MAG: hypothetical protein MI746_09405 [Pseudomonadales bacterium]|nr:hypothetical protein [Pseudomonadales bacterium]
MSATIRRILVGIWIVFLVLISTFLVNLGIEQSALIIGAPFMVLLPILGLMMLKPKEELLGWSLFTIWLSITYLSSGVVIEYLASLLIVSLAIIGGLFVPTILPFVWIAHIFWDFVPRDLPLVLQDLPVACLIFDGIIGVYLFWRVRKLRDQLPPVAPFFKSLKAQRV